MHFLSYCYDGWMDGWMDGYKSIFVFAYTDSTIDHHKCCRSSNTYVEPHFIVQHPSCINLIVTTEMLESKMYDIAVVIIIMHEHVDRGADSEPLYL